MQETRQVGQGHVWTGGTSTKTCTRDQLPRTYKILGVGCDANGETIDEAPNLCPEHEGSFAVKMGII